MQRRHFLHLLAATGLVGHLPLSSRSAQAADLDRFLVVVNAAGGWDPTSLCDPKGLNRAYQDNSDRHEGSTNSVDLDASKRYGDIQWSAIPEDASNNVEVRQRINSQFDRFFTQHGDRMRVINGIDTGTNNHDTGNRAVWSGQLDEGYPSLAALFAAANGPGLPMSYISNGGYDFTDSLVARARASSAGFVNQIADPNHYHDDKGFLYRSDNRSVDHYAMVAQAQQQRLQRQQQAANLPLTRRQLSQLFTVRNTDTNLEQLTVHLDAIRASVDRNQHWHENRANSLKSQAEVVVAAFRSQLAASANLNTGGFDTHGNHDANAYPRLGDLLEGVHFLMQCLESAGLAQRTTVVIGSDFGRTPYYNSGNGKDHWPLTSMLVIDSRLSGGRVFGATTADFRAQPVNRRSGRPDSGGEVLTTAHVNAALRDFVGIGDHTSLSPYPLNDGGFRLFS
ncbi:hypothetical protein GCM10011297_04240 [Bacterioplanes sanyensis]|uniref:DUF1501 domain-containing protein n=1 Tax=Bacterioplanes sanyensis TaxID=1249553 RepID=UPI001672DEC6|nr:DUF1501 domain-containing protein [Bacterioplanes sanyensis]GGY34353.1 hypothetical protein GCM10011297_04240 [Bacterioplanes sanyensis]